jgi:hypothetical protein
VLIFQIIGKIEDVENIAAGASIRDRRRLRKSYGGARWRKQKGFARVRLADGSEHDAELHWYESHGIGKREMRIKRLF